MSDLIKQIKQERRKSLAEAKQQRIINEYKKIDFPVDIEKYLQWTQVTTSNSWVNFPLWIPKHHTIDCRIYSSSSEPTFFVAKTSCSQLADALILAERRGIWKLLNVFNL